MQIIGSILIILAIADFGLSWLGINLTPFLPDGIARFSPIILGGLGYFFLNAKNFQSSSDDPALDKFREEEEPEEKSKKK